MAIAPGSLQRVEQGTLYFGRRAMPSVRFRYREAGVGRERTGILSTPDGAIYELAGALTTGAVDAWGIDDVESQPLQDLTASTHPHLSI